MKLLLKGDRDFRSATNTLYTVTAHTPAFNRGNRLTWCLQALQWCVSGVQGGGGRAVCKHLRWLNCWLEFSGPKQKSVRWIGRERFSCRWQRSVDCVFCAVNNKVRTYACGKLMSDHKDLGKSFASGHELLTLAGRGSPGTCGRCERHHRTHNNQTSAPPRLKVALRNIEGNFYKAV